LINANSNSGQITLVAGTDIKVQQDLAQAFLGARLTLDTYAQSVTPAKRAAQDAVIRLLLSRQSAFAAPGETR
jgi:hypothetical protein